MMKQLQPDAADFGCLSTTGFDPFSVPLPASVPLPEYHEEQGGSPGG